MEQHGVEGDEDSDAESSGGKEKEVEEKEAGKAVDSDEVNDESSERMTMQYRVWTAVMLRYKS